MLTGLTTEDKIGDMNSKMQMNTFMSNNQMMMTNDQPLLTNDIQNILNYRIDEDSKAYQFYDAQNPYLYVQKTSPTGQQQYLQSRKRTIYSNLMEVDKSVSEFGLYNKAK